MPLFACGFPPKNQLLQSGTVALGAVEAKMPSWQK